MPSKRMVRRRCLQLKALLWDLVEVSLPSTCLTRISAVTDPALQTFWLNLSGLANATVWVLAEYKW